MQRCFYKVYIRSSTSEDRSILRTADSGRQKPCDLDRLRNETQFVEQCRKWDSLRDVMFHAPKWIVLFDRYYLSNVFNRITEIPGLRCKFSYWIFTASHGGYNIFHLQARKKSTALEAHGQNRMPSDKKRMYLQIRLKYLTNGRACLLH